MQGFIAEWKAIFADKKLFISIIGILLIPVLYGGILLWAFWDPYGQLEELPVAIVNEDEGTEVDGEEVNAGDEFEDELLESEDFNWHVTDADEAQRGFDAFDYYFYVMIPSSFSEDVSSLQDDDPENGEIYYDINEDVNFAASQMGTQAVDTIEEDLSRTLTDTYVAIVDDAYSELTDAAVELEEGAEELVDGMDSALENMGSLTEGLAELDEGAESLHAGAGEAAEGTTELRTEVEEIVASYHNSEDIDQLEDRLGEMQAEVAAARSYLESDDAAQLEHSLHSLDENWSAARSSLQSAEDSLLHLADQLEDIDQPVQEAEDVLDDISAMNDRLDQWQNEANESLNDLETFVGACYEWQESVSEFNNADEEAQGLSDYIAENYPEDEELQGYADTLAETIDGIDSQDIQPCQQADETVNTLNETYDDIENGTSELSEQLETIEAAFNDSMDAISDGQEDISSWINEVNQDLENAQAATPEGIGEGDIDLLEVFPQARTTLAELDESLSQADDVLSSVDTTLAEAEQAVQTLDEGVQNLNEGANELSEEMQEALQGGLDIEDGLEELDDGAQELQENLQILVDTLLENELTEDQQALFSSPVESVAESETEDYTYGEGLSPYFLSLGLFVGGLTLSIIYPFYHPLAEHKTAWQWFSGKLGVTWSVATIQTIALTGVTFYGLDLDIASPAWFSFFMWFASLSFMALIFMLVAIMDNPGRFIAIILLIVQLGGSGGSFPAELVPPFFQYVHDWLPMTYSVEGLRATIMMGEPELLLETWPLLLVLLVSLGATFLFFALKHKREVAA
ncbi:YhgE/Pip domain-containing protein [Natribacillus halophilus]|uniref:Putative membrane protein n=1 Tax=Natribacillus halophilus TaxID=549003 RepID=A0A1G8QHW5_9BACI|nr:YhgE/Pip domain-containing protein [Natribacillus halophilus]SDJ04251.1 putative membrane protein [Natribacillus halophilus]